MSLFLTPMSGFLGIQERALSLLGQYRLRLVWKALILVISLIHDGSPGNMNVVDAFLSLSKKVTTKQRLKMKPLGPIIVFDKDLEEYYFMEPHRSHKIDIVGPEEMDSSGLDVIIQDSVRGPEQ